MPLHPEFSPPGGARRRAQPGLIYIVNTDYDNELIEPGSKAAIHSAAFDERLGDIVPVAAFPRIVTSPLHVLAYRLVDENLFSAHWRIYYPARFRTLPSRMRTDLAQLIDRIATGEDPFMRGESASLIVNTAGRLYDPAFEQLQEIGYSLERREIRAVPARGGAFWR